MAKILVIPDVHLKPWIFRDAACLMRQGAADRAVCLGDLADDFGQTSNVGLYEETYNAAMAFAAEFPDTLWCWGNHDYSYIIRRWQSGYSAAAEIVVQKKIREFQSLLRNGNQLQIVHRIDNVLFSHAGVSDSFVKLYCTSSAYRSIDTAVSEINSLAESRYGMHSLWDDISPLWVRPQNGNIRMYKPRKLLQVVGHTPVRTAVRDGNTVSCDTFSTHRDGSPYGDERFVVLDTESWELEKPIGQNTKKAGT